MKPGLIALLSGIPTMITVIVLMNLGQIGIVFLIIIGALLAFVVFLIVMLRLGFVYSSAGGIQVPESLKNMRPEEVIISRLTGHPDVVWYLTNERLILMQKTIRKRLEQPVGSLPIQGLNFECKRKTTSFRIAVWVICSLLSGIGILLVTLGYLGSINYTYYPPTLSWEMTFYSGLVALTVAVFLSPINSTYYQFLHPNLEGAGSDKRLWRIRETSKNKEPLKQFLSDIKDVNKTI